MLFHPTNINIKGIKLNNVDHLSSISFNNTTKKNRNVSGKKNQGIGQQHADDTLRIYSKSFVIDNEEVDSFSSKDRT